MGSGRLGNLIVRARLDRVDEVGELDGILDEEDRDVVSNNIKVAFVGVTGQCQRTFPFSHGQVSSTYNRVANPWTSLAVSALPRDPATVEKRTNTGVSLPAAPRKEAAVRLLQSA